MVPFNSRMHSTSSHEGHKHHRSQTLPIIRGKNALSNPKLLQIIDSSTASKYRNYLLPSGILWGLDQALYRTFLDRMFLKLWDWSHLSHFPIRFLSSFEDEQKQWQDVLTLLVQLVRVDSNLPFHLLWAVFFKIPLWLKVQFGPHLCCDETWGPDWRIKSSLTTLRRLFFIFLFLCCRHLQWNRHCTVCRHRGKHCYGSFPHNPWPVVSLHCESPGMFCWVSFLLELVGCGVKGGPGGAGTQKLKMLRQQDREIRYASPQCRSFRRELVHSTQSE